MTEKSLDRRIKNRDNQTKTMRKGGGDDGFYSKKEENSNTIFCLLTGLNIKMFSGFFCLFKALRFSWFRKNDGLTE